MQPPSIPPGVSSGEGVQSGLSEPSVAPSSPAPSPWLIREQIERLASHPTFSRSSTSVKLLRFFGENILDKGGRPVTQRDVADVLLGLSSEFRPTVNPLVRMQVVRLRRKLNDYYAGDGAADEVLIKLPKGSYRLLALWNPATPSPGSASPPVATPPAGGSGAKAILLVTELADDGLGSDWEGLAAAIAQHLVPSLLGHERFFAIGPLRRRRVAMEGLEPLAARDHYRADLLLDGELARDGDGLVATLRLLAPASDLPVWTHWCREALDALPVPARQRDLAASGRSELIDTLAEILAGRITILLQDAFPA